jgi:uracil-DNA glycosylase
MANDYWTARGYPWEYDPGPPRNRRWLRLFAATPNYRQLGKELAGRELFRWHFGPMFYRGRLADNAVKVLVIGQEGAQDESLSHRAFTGGTGTRMQHFLQHLGIPRSYLFLNTFVYTIFGQYGDPVRWLAQNPDSPIVQHRHQILDYVLERNDVHLIVAVGKAAKETVVTWVESRGGTCPAGAGDVSQCAGSHLDPRTRITGVRHPGGAGKGGSTQAIKADFQRAVDQVKAWIDAHPGWLPPDEDGVPGFGQPYQYRSAPIPFRDFPYGFPLRLGRGGTSSNRKDRQRSIQIFSAAGKYNAEGARLRYEDQAFGSPEGYFDEPGDLPYEPPKRFYREYDRGPGHRFAQLLMGEQPGLEWPNFRALGATAHPSFGCGPIYRGRPGTAHVLVLADQQCHDDLFTGRALTGDSGQHLQAFLEAMGILEAYVILRVLPVDTLDLDPAAVAAIVGHVQVRRVYQAIVDEIRAASPDLGLVLVFGPQARVLAGNLDLGGLPTVALKAWQEPGAIHDWQAQLVALQHIPYRRELDGASFAYAGQRGQIPRRDLPYGAARWIGTSGDRARRAWDLDEQASSADYYKLFLPDWVYRLEPQPLSSEEQQAIETAHDPGPD